MKPFNLEAAKDGAKVITRDGRAVTIINFNRKSSEDFEIVALIHESGLDDCVETFKVDGQWSESDREYHDDLLMAPIKTSGWVNIHSVYDSEGEAIESRISGTSITVFAEWEE